MFARWRTVQSETCNFLEWKNICRALNPCLLPFIEFENTTVCLLSSYEYRSISWTTHQTVKTAKCSARCSLTPSMFHHATLVSRSILFFPHPALASKANIPLILGRRSIVENVLCGIRRAGICVLVQTKCRMLITCVRSQAWCAFHYFLRICNRRPRLS